MTGGAGVPGGEARGGEEASEGKRGGEVAREGRGRWGNKERCDEVLGRGRGVLRRRDFGITSAGGPGRGRQVGGGGRGRQVGGGGIC